MSAQVSLPSTEPDRRDRILQAAERAFATLGFHAARMQDVANEARMSAGNLYRYFTSKDAIVSGLVQRDQSALSADFRRLAASGDLLSEVERMLRYHLVQSPAERVQLILEIWAEAARNPGIREFCTGLEVRTRDELAALVACRAGPGIDAAFVARLMETLCAGLFKQRGTDPAFDPDREIAMALAVFRAALDGRLALDPVFQDHVSQDQEPSR